MSVTTIETTARLTRQRDPYVKPTPDLLVDLRYLFTALQINAWWSSSSANVFQFLCLLKISSHSMIERLREFWERKDQPTNE